MASFNVQAAVVCQRFGSVMVDAIVVMEVMKQAVNLHVSNNLVRFVTKLTINAYPLFIMIGLVLTNFYHFFIVRIYISTVFVAPCKHGEFKCRNGFNVWKSDHSDPEAVCIKSIYICDINRDCSDGSDEDPDLCRGKYDFNRSTQA